MSSTLPVRRSSLCEPVLVGMLAVATLFTGSPARADPRPGEGSPTPPVTQNSEHRPQLPERERQFIQIIEDARKELKVSRSIKDVRMGMQIRVTNFYDQSHFLEGWLGTVDGTRVYDNGDVWIDIKIAEGITVGTVQTHARDTQYATLIEGGTKLAQIAADLHAGQPIQFTAVLFRYVTDSDEEMIKNPRLLAHFTSLKPLE